MKWLSLNTLNVASGVRISSGPILRSTMSNIFLSNNLHPPGMNDFLKALMKYCHSYLHQSIDETTLPTSLVMLPFLQHTLLPLVHKRIKDVKCRRWFTQEACNISFPHISLLL